MMMITKEAFKDYDKKVEENEVDLVNFKLSVRLHLKKAMKKSYVKSVLRAISVTVGLPIRYRIDLGEDTFLDQELVWGDVIGVLRTKDSVNAEKLLEAFHNQVENFDLHEELEVKGVEKHRVDDFRLINDVFDRTVYMVKLDLERDQLASSGESSGKWTQKVMKWDGSVVETKAKGTVKFKVEEMDSEASVYKVFIDVPHGLDVYKILEQEFSLKKGSLEGHPLFSIVHYKDRTGQRATLKDKKCKVTNQPIEYTVGGFVGEQSISVLTS